MRKIICTGALAAVIIGAPITLETVFTAAQTHAVTIEAKGHSGGGGEGHHERRSHHGHSAGYKCNPAEGGDGCNGNIPGYDNPNCWPGAIMCPPADSPPDYTVTDDPDEVVYAIGYRN